MLNTLLALFPATLTLLFTSDLHGRSDNLERQATRLRQCADCLIVDSGDTLQGNAEAFATQGAAMVAAMNALDYQAMALGNHDFDWGKAALVARAREAHFPFLSANIRQTAFVGGLPPIHPYQVLATKSGLRVGLIGITTPYTPRWLPDRHTEGLTFEDPVEAVRRVLPEVRRQCDVVVVLAHMGDVLPPTAENPTRRLNELAGIDLVLGGHTHQEVPLSDWGQLHYTQANKWGDRLGQATLAQGRWQVSFHDAPQSGQPLPELVAYRDQADRFVRQPVARLDRAQPGSRSGSSPLLNLVHAALLEATRADLAFHDVANEAGLPAGPISMGDVFNSFPYENQVVVATLTGKQIKELLALADQRKGQWNYAGLSRPAGELKDERTYRVATHGFLGAGGGGYTPFVGAPLERRELMVRDAVLQYLRQ